jgi:penicillin V acylase-like amidase (Ntn superfamily)
MKRNLCQTGLRGLMSDTEHSFIYWNCSFVIRLSLIPTTFFAFVLLFSEFSYACTVFSFQEGSRTFVANNLDWNSGQGVLIVNGRAVQKTAVFVQDQQPLQWVSQYKSVTFVHVGRDFPWEGMNEAGLSADVLVLKSSQFPNADDPRPAISGTQWLQYILDTSGTVDAAIEHAEAAKVTAPWAHAHYFICDALGQCAIFEYIDGALQIHRTGRNLPFFALANTSYDRSVEYLHHLVSTSNNREILDSPSSSSLDRFSRAALWSQGFESDHASDPVRYAFEGLRNVAQESTQWSIVFDLESRLIYFKTRQAPAVKTVNVNKFDPTCSSGALVFDVNSPQAGDVTSLFQDYTPATDYQLLERNSNVPPASRKIIENYPQKHTACRS